ncbi:UNVERIFIED_CONTAM: hypothetical protein FKN15_017549 [Acipenser sinensis]
MIPPKLQPKLPASAATGDGEEAGEAHGAWEEEPARHQPVPSPRQSRPAEVLEPMVQTTATETTTVTDQDGMFTAIKDCSNVTAVLQLFPTGASQTMVTTATPHRVTTGSVGKYIVTESGSIEEPHTLATEAFHAK